MTAAFAPRSTRKERIAWYLYDFGNSAYAAVVLLAVYSAYFQGEVVGGAEGSRLWGVAVAVAMAVVAVSAPVLGAIADHSTAKKKFLLLYTLMACLFTAALFFVQKGDILIGMTFFIVAEMGYRSAQVFYNGLLPQIAAPEEMGRISGTGWAIGSAGGVVCLLLILPLIVLIEGTFIVRLSLVITAVFFLLSAIPLFRWLPERQGEKPAFESASKSAEHSSVWKTGAMTGIGIMLLIVFSLLITTGGQQAVLLFLGAGLFFLVVSALAIWFWMPHDFLTPIPLLRDYLRIAFTRLRRTIGIAGNYREFLKFMLAFLIYNDGVIMALDFAAILGAVLYGMDQQMLIIFVIIVQITNVIGAYLFGVLVDRIGGKSSLLVSLALMVAVVIWMYFNETQLGFIYIGAVAGVAMAGIQSVSRTMVGVFAPRGQSAEFYGFFAMSGRTSSFIGPAVFGWVAAEVALRMEAEGMATDAAEQQGLRIAVLAIAAFLVLGTALLLSVNEKRAREAVQASAA